MTADGISRPEPLKTDMTVRVWMELPLFSIEIDYISGKQEDRHECFIHG
jgi:hypothetical protein